MSQPETTIYCSGSHLHKPDLCQHLTSSNQRCCIHDGLQWIVLTSVRALVNADGLHEPPADPGEQQPTPGPKECSFVRATNKSPPE